MLALGAALASAGSASAAMPDCGRAETVTGRVSRVEPGPVLGVDLGADMLRVRPAGLVIPQDLPAADAILADMVGRDVVVGVMAGRRDRRGRVMGHVATADGVWLQTRLLDAGTALRGTGVDDADCAAALAAAETAARQARRGLWAEASAVRAANAADLLDFAPNFAIVSGEVMSVGSAGGRFYLNFGRDWSRDMTATLTREAAAAFVRGTGALRPALEARLVGREIEVRGWLTRRDGPYMEVTDADAIVLPP
ncbi:thermonuclease family protein [Methylobrevis albus]|uniref:Thermonuclease family protein n=1 Tax=Methylobrevis albus TaxID=2793297 RepID=A0A931MZ31_9HYPH|nr:thermonuclease family protein [Methylobrevis albus]MBH0237341.1 thermonuclease family protein [Methylobrevis albus]